MSHRRIYVDGKPAWSENEPGYRARVSGQRSGGMVFIGGEIITGGPGQVDRDRATGRKAKAKRKAAQS